MQYVAILKQYSILADYSENLENYQDSLIKIFITNKQNIEFYMIPFQNEFDIYFLHFKEYTFSSICKQNQDSEYVLIFLQQLKQEFSSLIDNEKDSITIKATKLLKKTMDNYFASKKQDKVSKIEQELDAIRKEKHTLLNNMIDKEIKLDVEIEKSTQLFNSSNQTKYKARKVYNKSKNYWTRFKLLFILFTLVFIIYAIIKIKDYVYGNKFMISNKYNNGGMKLTISNKKHVNYNN